MKKKAKVTILGSTLKAIARYEAPFGLLLHSDPNETAEITYPEEYELTLDDLKAALENLLRTDPPLSDLLDWLCALGMYSEEFGIEKAMGNDEESERALPVGCLPTDRFDIFSDVWSLLQDAYECADPYSAHVSAWTNVKEALDELTLYLNDHERPVEMREFTDRQKERFISMFADDNCPSWVTSRHLMLARKYILELSEKDNIPALRIKGYACYGGNRLFECDWAEAERCMEKLLFLTDDPQYANTLGYIYCYGRTNGGTPEYEKAFRMFSLGAVHGLYESMYKLGDLFKEGLGCVKSPQTALKLYNEVYFACLERFADGDDCKFADAALRLGSVYLEGAGVQQNPLLAYKLYLEAELAIRLRRKHVDYFGDEAVEARIREGLIKAKAMIPKEMFEKTAHFNDPWILPAISCGGRVRAMLKLHKDPDTGDLLISAKPLFDTANGADLKKRKFLLSFPTLGYCKQLHEIRLTGVNGSFRFRKGLNDEIPFDSVGFDPRTRRAEFYCAGKKQGWIRCDEYLFIPGNKWSPTFYSVDGIKRE